MICILPYFKNGHQPEELQEVLNMDCSKIELWQMTVKLVVFGTVL
jgi:hypothetical protein